MIKINLSNVKKQVDISNIGGFDFSKIKIFAVLIVSVAIYLPDFILVPLWEQDRENAQAEVTSKQSQLSQLKRKVSQSIELEKQIKELKAQEESLGQKLLAVKNAISEKKNPWDLLYFLAKNLPSDLWINDLSLDEKEIKILGEALDYQSIGKFVDSMRSSVFISAANIGNTSSRVRGFDKRRIESFEIIFTIARFDP